MTRECLQCALDQRRLRGPLLQFASALKSIASAQEEFVLVLSLKLFTHPRKSWEERDQESSGGFAVRHHGALKLVES
jgi:hypothetical protein